MSQSFPPIGKKPEGVEAPLSLAQKRLWIIYQLDPQSVTYNIFRAWRLTGKLKILALESSLTAILQRHEILRTTFEDLDGHPIQRIHPPDQVVLQQKDFSSFPPSMRSVEIEKFLFNEPRQPFDLYSGPPIRFTLIQCSPNDYIFSFTVHHIVFDGWSMKVFCRELSRLYTNAVNNQSLLFQPLPFQYQDFAFWQHNHVSDQSLDSQLTFWKQQLERAPLVLKFPSDSIRDRGNIESGGVETFTLDPKVTAKLKHLLQSQRITLFMGLLGVYQILLARYTNQWDLLIGAPIANRNSQELEDMTGFFVNLMVLRGTFSPHSSFLEILKQVRNTSLNSYRNSDLPFEKIVEWLQPVRDPHRHPVVQAIFQVRDPSDIHLSFPEVSSRPYPVKKRTGNFDLHLVCEETDLGIQGSLYFAENLFSHNIIRQFIQHFQILLDKLIRHPHQPVSHISFVSEDDDQHQLSEPYASTIEYSRECHLSQLFDQQVFASPNATALVVGESHVTYAALNARANQLAHYLRRQGVGPEACVGVCLERGLELIVSLLAILKAGGAYVPFDPSVPSERLVYISEDANICLMLTTSEFHTKLPPLHCPVMSIDRDWAIIQGESKDKLDVAGHPDHLAYIIYTSGSTGLPKGVLISHYNVIRLFYVTHDLFQMAEQDVWTLFHSYAFDFSVWELWGALLYGGKLVIVPYWVSRAPDVFTDMVCEQRVTMLSQTPSAFRELMAQTRSTTMNSPTALRWVIFGGEALELASLRPWFTRYGDSSPKMMNMYGITEATVHVTHHMVTVSEVSEATESLIGLPLADLHTYLLDPHGQLVPRGVTGELYVGGAGVARGYLHQPALTAERFLPDGFSKKPGKRMYRSGDLTRYGVRDSLEYLGRRDNQIQLRGFRIELGEIEGVIQQHPAVKEAVVFCQEDHLRQKQLVAYVIRQTTIGLSALRAYLQERIPDYMVPAHFLFLEAFPLTSNGKINKTALPAPDGVRPDLDSLFEAPYPGVEQTLAGIWQDVLGIKEVGRHDNFFAVGGDSIKGIQIVARAIRVGIHIRPNQIFTHQTIAALAGVSSTQSPQIADQGLVTGTVPLTPIQHWFFSHRMENPHHWNMAKVISVPQRINPEKMEQAVKALINHHDALRLRFAPDGPSWEQTLSVGDENVPFTYYDYSTFAPSEAEQAYHREMASFHTRLHLSQGPVLQVGLFHFDEQVPNRIVMSIHHLVVDGISWRILVDDLQMAYEQCAQEKSITLPHKTTSFKHWALKLREYAHSDFLQKERDYWRQILATPHSPLPTDKQEGSNTEGSNETVTVMLSQQETHALLHEIPAVYHTQVNDLLLTALVLTLTSWTQKDTVYLDLEGHGREDLFADVDISRTVGWFTTIFPVKLTRDPFTHLGELVLSLKEQLRQIPGKGLGFGISRYLTPLATGSSSFESKGQVWPEVSFNYLGQFESVGTQEEQWDWSLKPSGATRDPHSIRTHVLEVSGLILHGKAHFMWRYSRHLHEQHTIAKLAKQYIDHLQALIQHCQLPDVGGYSPSDFPLAKVTPSQLKHIVAQVKKTSGQSTLTDLYPLTPLQQGLWFHALAAPDSSLYFEQQIFRMEGDLQVSAFRKAWQAPVARHAILRTGLTWEGLDHPLQYVLPTIPLPWEEHDWREESPANRETRLTDLVQADQARGFDLTHAPFLRLTLIRMTNTSYIFICSFHHLILDRWSVAIMWQEIWTMYHGIVQGLPHHLEPIPPFKTYIEWLEHQDLTSAESYWRETLHGFSQPTRLGIEQAHTQSRHQGGDYRTQTRSLPPTTTHALTQFAQQHQLTVNTLFQGAWALLLGHYSGGTDVVFGTTSSGRTVGLPGIEEMVGLFINSLPMRVNTSPYQPIEPWLRQLQDQQVQLRDLEYTPLFKIQQWSEVHTDTPLFHSLLVFENTPGKYTSRLETPDLVSQRLPKTKEGESNYPLTLAILPEQTLNLRMTYETSHFEESGIILLLDHFEQLLEKLPAHQGKHLGDLPSLTPQERTLILTAWNATTTEYPHDSGLSTLFEEQVAIRPDALAVVAGEAQLTYRQLHNRANQLAQYLRRHGVWPENRVGVYLERSLDYVVSLLAILKAGAAYVPLDPTAPAERVAFLVQDAAVKLLITQTSHRAVWEPLEGVPILVLDEAWPQVALQSTAPLADVTTSAALAYVMYTSGSTGQPKGTLISHRNIVRLVQATNYAQLDSSQRILQLAPMAFDASTFEVWGCLLNGGRLVIVPSGPLDLTAIGRQLDEERITTVWLTAGVFHQMVEHQGARLSQVRQVLAGGDVLLPEAVTTLLAYPGAGRVINGYGPTENTTFTCCQGLSAGTRLERTVPIGQPISNTQVYVVDPWLQLVPRGVTGELLAGGDGLAWGYLNQPGLTAVKFLPHPYALEPGARVYRTGDQVRWNRQEALEFLGRRDGQVKIRGFRVELGEIEAILQQHPVVQEAVVLCREKRPGDNELMAYVVTPTEEEILMVRTYLRQQLPDYMVPSVLAWIQAMPLTPNGKIDKRALPTPERADRRQGMTYVAPETVLERLLTTMWEEVLKVEKVGIHDNFFELGGHSLLATQVVTRLRSGLEVDIPIRIIFDHPTIRQLGQVLDAELTTIFQV